MSAADSSRFDYIDLLKGLGIFLVVWGHTMTPRSIYIYSFHMPLFFFLAGYVHQTRPFKEFLFKKINSLYIPYFVFSLFSWIFYLVRILLFQKKVLLSIHLPKIASLFTGTADNGGNNPIWFLTCLLMVSLFFLALQLFIRNEKILPWVILLSSGVGYTLSLLKLNFLFNIDIAFSGLVFYYFGYQTKRQNFLSSFTLLRKSQLVALIAGLEILHITAAFMNIKYSGIHHVNMAGNVLGDYFFFYLSAFCGIAAYSTAGYFIKTIGSLNFLGLNTLVILAAHKPALVIINDLANLLEISQTAFFGLSASIAAIIISLASRGLFKKFPRLIGKNPVLVPGYRLKLPWKHEIRQG